MELAYISTLLFQCPKSILCSKEINLFLDNSLMSIQTIHSIRWYLSPSWLAFSLLKQKRCFLVLWPWLLMFSPGLQYLSHTTRGQWTCPGRLNRIPSNMGPHPPCSRWPIKWLGCRFPPGRPPQQVQATVRLWWDYNCINSLVVRRGSEAACQRLSWSPKEV